MKSLLQIIKEAEDKKVAVGHFNISDSVGLQGIFQAAKKLNLPVVIGVSEGERSFIGVKQIAALVRSLREEYDYPIYLNADHTHSFEKIKNAVEAGFDAVLFDAGKFSLEENIKQTKSVVEYVKSINPEILVEAELGYIGAGSVILESIPEDATIKEEDLTKPLEAGHFAKETGIDLLAPAVGNIHGILKDMPQPNLSIQRIKEIREAAGVPLVLHGGSGISNADFMSAIEAGISTIHINTEIRLAWRLGLDVALKENPAEIVPYKLMKNSVAEIAKTVEARLKLFNKIS